jgi:DNA polymerase-3 subunit beta
MKLILLKNNLTDSLNCAERAVGNIGKLPILKNILIKGSEGKIFLEATDLEIAVSCLVPGKVLEDGSVTVPFSIFNSVIKNLTSERLTLESQNQSLMVVTDNYEASIQGSDTSDFPIIPTVEENKNTIKLPAEFMNSLELIMPATQYSEIRPEISGIYFSYKDSVLTLTATDSFRLAEKKITNSELVSDFDSITFILPLKAAEEVLRVFPQNSEITAIVDESQVCFTSPGRRLTSRLVDGKFPDYQTIIPSSTETEVLGDRGEFLQAVRLVSSFAGKTNDVGVKLNGKHLEIFSADSSGSNSYKIAIKNKGENFEAMFNWRYLFDAFKMYSCEEVLIGVNSPDKPVCIKNPKDNSLIYIVMPIRR